MREASLEPAIRKVHLDDLIRRKLGQVVTGGQDIVIPDRGRRGLQAELQIGERLIHAVAVDASQADGMRMGEGVSVRTRGKLEADAIQKVEQVVLLIDLTECTGAVRGTIAAAGYAEIAEVIVVKRSVVQDQLGTAVRFVDKGNRDRLAELESRHVRRVDHTLSGELNLIRAGKRRRDHAGCECGEKSKSANVQEASAD